jgi:hypothetical protein
MPSIKTNFILLDVQCEAKGLKVNAKQGVNEWFVYLASIDEQEGRAKFHLHIFFKSDFPPDTIVKILPKSGNWREGNEPDLINFPYDQWLAQINGTDSSTQGATRLFLEVLRENNYVRQD